MFPLKNTSIRQENNSKLLYLLNMTLQKMILSIEGLKHLKLLKVTETTIKHEIKKLSRSLKRISNIILLYRLLENPYYTNKSQVFKSGQCS